MATATLTAQQTRLSKTDTTRAILRLSPSARSVSQPTSILPSSTSFRSCPDTKDPHHLPFRARPRSTRPIAEPILYLPPVHISLPSDSAESYRIDARGIYSPLRRPADAPDALATTAVLHEALHHFRPVTDDHAQMPYAEAFNWGELLLPVEMELEWYAVASCSTCKSGSVGGPLYEQDEQAHLEALSSGGLLLYWRGPPNLATATTLTTCIWQSRAHAITANSGPHHIRALRQAVASCERFELRRYRLRKLRGERTLRVEAYDRGDEGW